jgi:hypothetical protein
MFSTQVSSAGILITQFASDLASLVYELKYLKENKKLEVREEGELVIGNEDFENFFKKVSNLKDKLDTLLNQDEYTSETFDTLKKYYKTFQNYQNSYKLYKEV